MIYDETREDAALMVAVDKRRDAEMAPIMQRI